MEFDPISTYPRKFTHSGGQVEQMDFLHHSFTDLLYLQGEGAQGVVLPYDDGRLAFAAILPDSPDLGGWLDSLKMEMPCPNWCRGRMSSGSYIWLFPNLKLSGAAHFRRS